MPLRIPQTQKEAFKAFMELPDKEADSILRALEVADPAISVDSLAKSILPNVGLGIGALRKFISVAGSLYLARDQQGVTAAQLADAAASAAMNEGLLTSDESEKASKLKERVAKFLALDRSLGVSAKATLLLVRHKNPLSSARIFTDVRPVFTGDVPVPQAAVCFHTLELITNTDGRRSSYYAALDSADLMSLKKVVDRAIQKEKAIRQAMKTLPLIEVQDDEE
jgi:hypothetical protein